MSQQMLGMNDYSSWMNSKNTVLSCESEFTKPFNAGALESMCEKHQIAEEPYNGKLLRAVLKLTITHKSKNGEKAAILLIQLSIINRSMV